MLRKPTRTRTYASHLPTLQFLSIPSRKASSHSPSRFHTHTHTQPASWYTASPECNNNLQSPIDLRSIESEAAGAAFLRLWVPRRAVTNATAVVANGPSLVVDMLQRGITLTGEGFWSQYKLHEMRYHAPAEHLLEGVRHPLERQLVFYPSDLEQLTGAQRERHPIVVISEVYAVDDSRPDPMVTALMTAGFGGTATVTEGAASGGAATSLANFKPAFGSFLHDDFYVYPGSLTHPPCSEVVTWLVATRPRTVTPPQRVALENAVHTLTGVSVNGHPFPKETSFPNSVGNARPRQDANNRTIKKQRFYSVD